MLDETALGVGTLVLATGGGVVLDERNRQALERCTVVWLRASVDELVDRLRHTGSRDRCSPATHAPPSSVSTPSERRSTIGGGRRGRRGRGRGRRRGRAGRRDARRAAMMVSTPSAPLRRTERPMPPERHHEDDDVITVEVPLPAGRSYPVVVGAGAPRSGRVPAHRAPGGSPWSPSRRSRSRSIPAASTACGRSPTARRTRPSPRSRPLLGVRSSRTHPFRLRRGARRGSGHRCRRVRRRQLPPGDRRRTRADDAARPDRRCDRRQDRCEPARGQEPGRRLLAAEGGGV